MVPGLELPGPATWPGSTPEPGADVRGAPGLTLDVPLGRRVMVVGDLLLEADATPSSLALAADVALTLDQWQGPGLVIVCGNLFNLGAEERPLESGEVARSLDQHDAIRGAIAAFTARDDCRLLVLPGWRDPEVASAEVSELLGAIGAEVAGSVDLRLTTAAGERIVGIRAGCPPDDFRAVLDGGPADARPWLAGVNRLEDPTASGRFVTSRLLYRRLGRYVWVPPLLAVVAALVLRLQPVYHGLRRIARRGQRGVIGHAYHASWAHRLLFTLAVIVALELLLAVVVAIISRRIWRAEMGSLAGSQRSDPSRTALAPTTPSSGLLVGPNAALDEARAAVALDATGLIVGGGLRAELTHLDPGFFASPGGTTELVREHAGRAGLPPVFLHHRQASWLELETGAELHVRLLLADVDLPLSTKFERVVTGYPAVKGYKAAADLHPAMVASWPRGASWPAAPDVAADRIRMRRVRRWAAFAIFVAGLVDVLLAVSPPLRSRLHLIETYLPLGVAQAAGALVALAGVALMMLSRGILRGQRRSWIAAVVLLAVTLVLHIVHAASFAGLLVTGVTLALLLVERARFGAATDRGSVRSAALALFVGVVVAVGTAFVAAEISGRVRHHPLPAWPEVLGAMLERMAGFTSISLPDTLNDFVSPSLLAVGVALVVIVLYLVTRPVVDRQLSSGWPPQSRRAAEGRARDIVRRHGTGTLDYFALRDDKQWFFFRDTVVAYAVHGGVCLVSPDPIGPVSERSQVWDAFRHFADRHGWGVAVMAAAEEWLPIYRDSGMRHLYIGDEAVVDVTRFTLAGGKMKGLRQACSRIERNGYKARFFDPSRLDPALVPPLVELMGLNRRGENERGFSMMLGRIFDPRDTGLLLTVVYGPDGRPAAMCQFVPSQAIDGFSLDLMRRDPAEHPNGLLDFALCSTIQHLKELGQKGLSLNFAALRSTLDGETGDGIAQRVERWALRRMSGVLQIETLWKFNAKYDPDWLPRYIVYDSPEQFAPATVAILRAESLTEVPVVGRLLTTGVAKRSGPGIPEQFLAHPGDGGDTGRPASEPDPPDQ